MARTGAVRYTSFMHSRTLASLALLGISVCAAGAGDGFLPVSYTHLTLPTNREV